MLWLVHCGGLAFTLFVVSIAILSLYEYGVILALGGRPAQRLNALLLGALLAACAAFDGPLGLALAVSISVVVLTEMFAGRRSLERAALTLFGAIVLGWMPAHLALLRELRPFGERLTFLLFGAIWAMDSAAYFVGSALGRHPLAPEISPQKTWEGFIAGAVCALLAFIGYRIAAPQALSTAQALALAVSVGVGAQVSDLAESMIKRAVGAKDSGNLLPGHGGVMDRFDSFLLAAPAAYYCLRLI